MEPSSFYATRSPSSSPSLTAIDSSPPSSSSLAAICTPPASPGVQDPFAGSSKSVKRPRIYDQNSSHKSHGAYASESAEYSVVSVLDATPTRLVRVVDPLSGSAKPHWQPPAYEKRFRRVVSDADASSTHSSPSRTHTSNRSIGLSSVSLTPRAHACEEDASDTDDISLTDEEGDLLGGSTHTKTVEQHEARLWDGAINRAIDDLDGVTDLRCVLCAPRTLRPQ